MSIDLGYQMCVCTKTKWTHFRGIFANGPDSGSGSRLVAENSQWKCFGDRRTIPVCCCSPGEMPGVCSSPPAALAKIRRGYTNLCIDRCILDLIAFQHRRMSFDLGIISDQIIIHACLLPLFAWHSFWKSNFTGYKHCTETCLSFFGKVDV